MPVAGRGSVTGRAAEAFEPRARSTDACSWGAQTDPVRAKGLQSRTCENGRSIESATTRSCRTSAHPAGLCGHCRHSRDASPVVGAWMHRARMWPESPARKEIALGINAGNFVAFQTSITLRRIPVSIFPYSVAYSQKADHQDKTVKNASPRDHGATAFTLAGLPRTKKN